MYQLQKEPDKAVVLGNGNTYTPIATLKDEYDGVSHIIVDDHCYVLVNELVDGGFTSVTHWFSEAVAALKTLPSLRTVARCIITREIG